MIALQVKTIDGRTVWRRRHYRVKRAAKPGTFRFSVSALACPGPRKGRLCMHGAPCPHAADSPRARRCPSSSPTAQFGSVSCPARFSPHSPHCFWQVLDNGVTSNEFWRILDCDEGLEW